MHYCIHKAHINNCLVLAKNSEGQGKTIFPPAEWTDMAAGSAQMKSHVMLTKRSQTRRSVHDCVKFICITYDYIKCICIICLLFNFKKFKNICKLYIKFKQSKNNQCCQDNSHFWREPVTRRWNHGQGLSLGASEVLFFLSFPPFLPSFYNLHPRMCHWSERERKGERERTIDQLPPVRAWTRNRNCNIVFWLSEQHRGGGQEQAPDKRQQKGSKEQSSWSIF